VIEGETLEERGLRARLRVDEFQLVAPGNDDRIAGLGADTDPVDPSRQRQRAVGLDRDLETLFVEGDRKIGIDLQQRLAARQHHERLAAGGHRRPFDRYGLGERLRCRKTPAARPVEPDEIGIAKAAGSRRAVLLAAGPQVAAGKAAKDGRAAGIPPLTLQGVENFLDRVSHR
jgi:hypothetical protein